MNRYRILLCVLALLALPFAAQAATVTVTPANLQGWGPQNVQATGTVGITAAYPNAANGSLQFTQTTGGSDKADYELDNLNPGGFGLVKDITQIGYQFYRNSTSTVPAFNAPVLRLGVFDPVSGRTSLLIYEPVYNGYPGSVPTNGWVTVDATGGNWWMRAFHSPTTCSYQVYDITLAEWASGLNNGNPIGTDPFGCTPNPVGNSAWVYAINTGIGSGWTGSFNGAVDNITIAFLGNATTYNFEPNPVNPVGPVAPATCISTVHAPVTVPMNISRTDATPLRGYSVTFSLSGNLMLNNGTASITQGSYLSGTTNFQVTDNGGGSYTADCVILGVSCPLPAEPASGTLFNVSVKNSDGDGTGTVTVTNVTLRDCNNDPVNSSIGPAASITIDNTLPAAIADLAAVQQTASNPAGQTSNVNLSWSPVEAGATVQAYRIGFGGYPEYTGAAPTAPATPAAAVAAGWTPVLTAPGADHTAVRDYYYYVAFVTDGCGNVSAVSNMTGGTLNYFLGDVTNGVSPGTGDNLVNTVDITLLGGHYGNTLVPSDPFGYLDVGPTTTHRASGRPLPDDHVNFEDLIIFSMNYGLVSKPSLAQVVAAAKDELALEVSGSDAITARLLFQGTGRVQGIATQLKWNAAAVEPVSVGSGSLLEQENGVAFSGAPGSVDVALLGANRGLLGEGTLATVTFRRIGDGDPGIALASVEARDTKNEPVELGTARPGVNVPSATALGLAAPNPSRGTTTLEYSLAVAGTVQLSIYSVDGRKVASLVSGSMEAGLHHAVWDGMNQVGARVSPGVYFARLQAGGGSFVRTLTVLK